MTATATTASASPRPQEQLGVSAGIGVPGARERNLERQERNCVAKIGCFVE